MGDDVLAPARKIFKVLYREGDRTIPNFIPHSPAEKEHDKEREAWMRAYQDGSMPKIEENDENVLIYFDVDSYEIHRFEKKLPKNTRSEKRGNKIEIRNPDNFMKWFGKDEINSHGFLNKIKSILR